MGGGKRTVSAGETSNQPSATRRSFAPLQLRHSLTGCHELGWCLVSTQRNYL